MEELNFSKEIVEISGGDKQFESELINIILRQTPVQLLNIERSLHNANWTELQTHIHKLQSTFVLLNILRGIELAELIRKTAGINKKQTNKDVNEIVTICDQLITSLKKYSTI